MESDGVGGGAEFQRKGGGGWTPAVMQSAVGTIVALCALAIQRVDEKAIVGMALKERDSRH
jgi:hypothetical protein